MKIRSMASVQESGCLKGKQERSRPSTGFKSTLSLGGWRGGWRGPPRGLAPQRSLSCLGTWRVQRVPSRPSPSGVEMFGTSAPKGAGPLEPPALGTDRRVTPLIPALCVPKGAEQRDGETPAVLLFPLRCLCLSTTTLTAKTPHPGKHKAPALLYTVPFSRERLGGAVAAGVTGAHMPQLVSSRSRGGMWLRPLALRVLLLLTLLLWLLFLPMVNPKPSTRTEKKQREISVQT